MMKINLVVIRTPQPKQLADFYQELGMEFEYHRHGKGSWHYSTILGETTFEIYPLLKSQTEADKSLRIGFNVKNLNHLITDLQKKNIQIIKEPQQSEWGYFAVIKDLDGRKIELKEIEI